MSRRLIILSLSVPKFYYFDVASSQVQVNIFVVSSQVNNTSMIPLSSSFKLATGPVHSLIVYKNTLIVPPFMLYSFKIAILLTLCHREDIFCRYALLKYHDSKCYPVSSVNYKCNQLYNIYIFIR